MFSGIVEIVGRITSTQATAHGRRLVVEVGELAKECELGASVCICGVCLTVAEIKGTQLGFDVVSETLKTSTMGSKSVGGDVNIERSLRVGDRVDGHFVQGHVDGTARISRIRRESGDHEVWLEPAPALLPYMVPKGSVAIDGVSLTIATLQNKKFSVALIPTTLQRTTLGALSVCDVVNIETDIITRTIVHQMTQRSHGAITNDSLKAAGFS